MKIESLQIDNFRGILRAKAEGLGKTIIIAGQNGSGKSCVFDAIRLLKSVYGGYQQNEWQNWLGEFAIPGNAKPSELLKMFNDESKILSIQVIFTLSESEKEYITANVDDVLTDAFWRLILPEAFQYGSYRFALFAQHFRDREPEVKARVSAAKPKLLDELTKPTFKGHLTVKPGESLQITESLVLSILFSTYQPQSIGVIDYHGAQRHYGRESLQAVNISLDVDDQKDRQHALYNYTNKYNNIKSELAASYIKEIFSKEAGVEVVTDGLTSTLTELFETFFPDKRFGGPTPTKDGALSFPVITPTGTHDLDDLSAGEKEILYGYLRIRNSAPQNSIIFLDEPELHLNPRLIRRLPEFYRKHLGEALNNQIWLVSHSDALLRESIGKPGFDLFHMQPCSVALETVPEAHLNHHSINQLHPLSGMRDVDVLLADLIGDLAAYEPGRRAIIFEGGGGTDFDQQMVSRLFPEIAKTHNLISGSSKEKVRALFAVLAKAYEGGDIKTKFFAVTDSDFDRDVNPPEMVDVFSWDVYHIENYLLMGDVIANALSSLTGKSVEVADVNTHLEAAARACVDFEVRHRLVAHVNRELVRQISIGAKPESLTLAKDVATTADNSIARLNAARGGELTDEKLEEFERNLKSDIDGAFADGSWVRRLPGREILKKLVGHYEGVSYAVLRNVVLSLMVDRGIKPVGMQSVIAKIEAAD